MKVLERFVAIGAVTAGHLVLLFWITSSIGQTPPKIVQPTIQGVLIAAQPAPVQPPAPVPPQPEPAPVPPPPEPPPPQPPPPPPPEPPPPKKPEPKPKKPEPKPLPPSKRSVTAPEPVLQPLVSDQRASAALPERTPLPAPSAPPAPAAPPPLVPPRTDAAHLNNPKPTYPALARRMGEEGKVLLDVHIQPDGSVREIRVRESSGSRRLDQAALDAVQRWRYLPARRGDVAIAFWYVQPIVFSLQQ